jgi:hypothetical protein
MKRPPDSVGGRSDTASGLGEVHRLAAGHTGVPASEARGRGSTTGIAATTATKPANNPIAAAKRLFIAISGV